MSHQHSNETPQARLPPYHQKPHYLHDLLQKHPPQEGTPHPPQEDTPLPHQEPPPQKHPPQEHPQEHPPQKDPHLHLRKYSLPSQDAAFPAY